MHDRKKNYDLPLGSPKQVIEINGHEENKNPLIIE